jgi:RHS repeat-associated protein
MTYDGIGNPLTWTDPNGAWTATWTMGRQLATLSKTGTSISYKYGADGIRTEKTVNGVTTVYNVVGGVVTWEKTGTNSAIHYIYDANGDLFGLEYGGNSWFYVRNAQNDVIGLVEASSGTWTAQYIYDAWGKPLAVLDGSGNDVSGNASHIANVNPYRYRGYRFDLESGLGYLESRYYNLSWNRFISSDGHLGGTGVSQNQNLYTYCSNNPIMFSDSSGRWIESALDIAGLAWSIYDMSTNPSWENAGWLLLDVICLALPVITGSYAVKAAVKGANAVDTAADSLKTIDKAQDALVVTKPPIVIGENMNRVESYAKLVGADYYKAIPNKPFDFDIAMKRNKRWIADMKRNGRQFIDIGPDFERRRTKGIISDFYNMERKSLKGYDNYQKVFTRNGSFGGLPWE